MSIIRLPFNFEPRSYQLPFLKAMDSGYNRAVCVWHRRSGKDKVFVNYLAKKTQDRVGLYLYLFPTYKQGRKILWNGIDKSGFKYMNHFPEELVERTNNTEMAKFFKNGSVFQIAGTDDIDSLMGTNPVGVVFSEYSLQNPSAWDLIRPILAENDGWAIFNFTPRGRNHGFILAEMARTNPKWFFQLLTVDDTRREDGKPVVTPEMIEDERLSGMAEDMVQQEFFCSFDAALESCFFSDAIGRHSDTEFGTRGNIRLGDDGGVVFEPDDKGILEVWKFPYRQEGGWDGLRWDRRYSVGSDIGEGLGQDYSVAYVYDRETQEFVARMRSNKIDSHLWGELLFWLSQYYDNAIIVPERTGAGITTCKRLGDLRANVYFNMIPAKAGGSPSKMIGWVESKEAKYNMAGDLREYLKTTIGRVRCPLLLHECSVFIKTEGGKLEADEGFHDDCVIAAGLAIQGSFFMRQRPSQGGHKEQEEAKVQAVRSTLPPHHAAVWADYDKLRESWEGGEELAGWI